MSPDSQDRKSPRLLDQVRELMRIRRPARTDARHQLAHGGPCLRRRWRLLECLRLRVKDIDFENRQLVIRDAKGQKDRVTLLPQKLFEPLRNHLVRVRGLHEALQAKNAIARAFSSAG